MVLHRGARRAVALAGGMLLASACISSCGGDSEDAPGANLGPGDDGAGAAGNAGTGSGAGGGFGNPGDGDGDGDGDGIPMLPPEEEVRLDFELPQASEQFVFAANPDSGTVSIINAESRHIQTIETGEGPTFLGTLAGTDDAIVLNVGSDDATIIRNPDGRAATSNVKSCAAPTPSRSRRRRARDRLLQRLVQHRRQPFGQLARRERDEARRRRRQGHRHDRRLSPPRRVLRGRQQRRLRRHRRRSLGARFRRG